MAISSLGIGGEFLTSSVLLHSCLLPDGIISRDGMFWSSSRSNNNRKTYRSGVDLFFRFFSSSFLLYIPSEMKPFSSLQQEGACTYGSVGRCSALSVPFRFSSQGVLGTMMMPLYRFFVFLFLYEARLLQRASSTAPALGFRRMNDGIRRNSGSYC